MKRTLLLIVVSLLSVNHFAQTLMVVLDLGHGRIGAVSYNSSPPPSARTAEIPFAISASTGGNDGGLAGVLSQLKGARVIVATQTRVVTGSKLTDRKPGS